MNSRKFSKITRITGQESIIEDDIERIIEGITLKDIREHLEKLFLGKEFIPYKNLSKNYKRRRTIRETLKRIHKLSRSTDINDVKLSLIDIISKLEPNIKEIFKFFKDVYEGYERVCVGDDEEIYFWVEVIYEPDEKEDGIMKVSYITITDEDKLFRDMY